MEEVIKLAIYRGYEPYKTTSIRYIEHHFMIGDEYIGESMGLPFKIKLSAIREDPLFWQALGKALGWGELTVSRDDWTQQPKWLYEWHRFIDHLAFGKDTDSFFSALISNK